MQVIVLQDSVSDGFIDDVGRVLEGALCFRMPGVWMLVQKQSLHRTWDPEVAGAMHNHNG